jgi:DNA polymerase-1
MPRLMIVDGLNQFVRAYIVNPSLSTNGQPIGGIVGTLKILQKLCKEVEPDEIIVCWDGEGGSSKRKSMNKGYKEGRKPVRLNRDVKNLSDNEEIENKIWQQTRLAEYFNELPIIQLLYPSIEADDLISYVSQHSHYADWQKVIISADKDFIQLVNNKTILFRPIQEQILNVAKVLEEFSIHPNNFALARSITGDDSDNLKGIKGIGLASAAKRIPMLQESKTLTIQELIDFCSQQGNKVKAYSNICENSDVIKDNYKIMQLSSPQISIQTKLQINNVLTSFEPQMNHTEFKKMSIQDGFGVVDFSSLFTTMKKILNGKNV